MTMNVTVMSEARFASLLANARVPVEHKALWSLLWDAEMRLTDALSADVRDLDRRESTVVSENGKSGGSARQRVPLSDRTMRLLDRVIRDRAHGPLFVNVAGDPLSREAVQRWARSVGHSVHAFRLGGQVARRASL
jgi:integrase